MKQLFRSLMFVAAATGLFAGCSKTDETTPLPQAPSMVWTGNDLEAVHEITDPMSVKIDILVPGGLQKLALEIDSPALTAEMLEMVGLSTKMELTHPATTKMEETLEGLNLPVGKKIVGSQKQVFDISTLVPLIKALSQEDSEHRFKVTVTDASNQSITKTLRFHLAAGAPQMVWEGQDLDALHEITDPMSIKIDMLIPGKLQKLELEIDSPALTAEIIGMVGLATKMELTNPATTEMEAALKAFGLPAGKEIVGSQKQIFDISTLVPMIKAIYPETSEHRFKVTITDALNQSISKTLRFHLTGESTVDYNNDADLWKNTATLSAVVRIEGEVKIEYRKKGAAVWQAATVTKGEENAYQATIAPTWKAEGKHATGVDQFSLDNNTGIFAGNTYEYRLTVAGTEIDKKEFKTTDGQKIPFSDMNTWSKYIGYQSEWVGDPTYDDYKTFYPNKSIDDQFWGNGNNAFTQKLCQPDTLSTTNYAAKVKGELAFGSIFAAGNLFSGVFAMDGVKGYARFGQKYAYTARPSAIKVRMKTSINKITQVSASLTPPNGVKKGDTDPSRFFVCITNWGDRHSVCSGMIGSVAEINPFDPVSDKAEPTEGAVIAYGSKTFTTSITGWQDVVIPILYKDKEAKPAADKYSLVISTASSAYGDYLCGCVENELVIDYVEWVY